MFPGRPQVLREAVGPEPQPDGIRGGAHQGVSSYVATVRDDRHSAMLQMSGLQQRCDRLARDQWQVAGHDQRAGDPYGRGRGEGCLACGVDTLVPHLVHDAHAEVACEHLNLCARCDDHGVPHHGYVPQRGDDPSRQDEVHGVSLLCSERFQQPAPGAGRMFQGYEGADICHNGKPTTAAWPKQRLQEFIFGRPQQTVAARRARVLRELGVGAPARHPLTCGRPSDRRCFP
ncbi:MAG: hypothetical protein QOI59_4360 [Gammaproteobacteria bacterium]|nr:hypothetical protein [Gammaproteobacteria bacterium]